MLLHKLTLHSRWLSIASGWMTRQVILAISQLPGSPDHRVIRGIRLSYFESKIEGFLDPVIFLIGSIKRNRGKCIRMTFRRIFHTRKSLIIELIDKLSDSFASTRCFICILYRVWQGMLVDFLRILLILLICSSQL